MARNRTLLQAFNADLAVLDGSFAGRETLVASGRKLVAAANAAEDIPERVTALRELRMVMTTLRAGAVKEGEDIDGLLAEFGTASVVEP